MRVTRLGIPEPKDTTHVCAIDNKGMCVSMTHSLGMPSGVITDGLGFMYNGCMAVFDPRPGRQAGSIAPASPFFLHCVQQLYFRMASRRWYWGTRRYTDSDGRFTSTSERTGFRHVDCGGRFVTTAFVTSDVIDITNRIPGYLVEPLERDEHSYPFRDGLRDCCSTWYSN